MIAKLPVRVGFDPTVSAESNAADVWNIPAGRILMLLWRPCHLCSDEWWRSALPLAREIQRKQPKTIDELRSCFLCVAYRSVDFPSHGNTVAEFCRDAIPYFSGQSGVPYTGTVEGIATMDMQTIGAARK